MKILEIILIVIGIINIIIYLFFKRKEKLKLFYKICNDIWDGKKSYYGIIYTFNKKLEYKEVFKTPRYFYKFEAIENTEIYMKNMLKC